MFKKFIKNNQGGTILLITLLVLASILLITMMSADIIQNGIQVSRTQLYSTKAFYAAESGAELILWEARKKSPQLSTSCTSDFPGFTDMICFDKDDRIIADTNNPCQNPCNSDPLDKTVTLSNDSTFDITYTRDETAIPPFSTLTSRGHFEDSMRVVEVTYTE
jgi:Tfp pilus assembly protein PilX